jgi:FlaA1/EpsC-like NDP-sugar epimerase
MHVAPRQRAGVAPFLQFALELGWLVIAVILAIRWSNDHTGLPSYEVVAAGLVFALLMVGLNAAFGLYRRDLRLAFGEYALRQAVVLAIALAVAYVASLLLPGRMALQQALVPTIVLVLAGLVVVRQMMVSPIARVALPYRVLVLGTGPEAQAVEASLTVAKPPELQAVLPIEGTGQGVASVGSSQPPTPKSSQAPISTKLSLPYANSGGVLPLRALLECRLNGCR